jgi:hypothetical protein
MKFKDADEEEFATQICIVHDDKGQPHVITYDMMDKPDQIAELLNLKTGEMFSIGVYQLLGTPRFVKRGKGSLQ